MTPEKLALLDKFLGGVPGSLAQRLARAAEVDRLTGSNVLPAERMLASLRPILRKAPAVERASSPQRLFCKPFEDLLGDGPRKEKRKGRIARASITPVWHWLETVLLPREAAGFSRAASAAVIAYKLDEAAALAHGFWTLASAAIRNALGDAQACEAARQTLGDPLVLADVEEMALLLSAGAQVETIQNAVPRMSNNLSESALWTLRDIHEQVLESNSDVVPYVTVITMGRLTHPWEALRLPLLISHRTQDTLIASTDMGLAGELLFHDIADCAREIRNARQPEFDVEALLAAIAKFAEYSAAVVKAVDIRRDGRWGQSLIHDRAAVGDAMSAFMEKAPREILAVLPMQKQGGAGWGPRMPDVSHTPDADRVQRALRYATLLSRSRNDATAASFASARNDAVKEVSRELRVYNDAIVEQMRDADDELRARAQPHLDIACGISALVLGEVECGLTKRRARAAQVAA